MGYIPIKSAKEQKNTICNSFFGLNRKEYAKSGELADTENLSSDNFPYLSPSKKKSPAQKYNKIINTANSSSTKTEATNIRAVIEPGDDCDSNGFCGVIGTSFYYNGKKKPLYQPAVRDESGNYLYGMEIPEDGEIQLLWVNKTIVIHGYGSKTNEPFVYYYDTAVTDTESGDCVLSYEYDHTGNYGEYITVKENGIATITFNAKVPLNYKKTLYSFKTGDSVFIDGLMKYNESRFGQRLKSDITSAVVNSYTETRIAADTQYETRSVSLELSVYNYLGESPAVTAYTRVYHIYKKIPPMTHLTLHYGRLWGAAANGEAVYASALNDIFDFNRFDGISDDSVYIETSTKGGFLGVVSCSDAIIALKKDSIEAVYGSLPTEFAIGKQYKNIGCIDINSCAVAGNTLYFLGRLGFYMWNGSYPKLISEALDRKYSSAYGYTDGEKYRACAHYENGYENLTYDIKKALWHKEDSTVVKGAFLYDNEFYFLIGGRLYTESESDGIAWCAKSAKFFAADYDLDRVSEIRIYAKLPASASICVYTRSDEGEWINAGEIKSGGKASGIYRVPIRPSEGIFWQYMLKGNGRAVVYGINLLLDKGGKSYSNERRNVT